MAEKSGFQVNLPEGLRSKLRSLQRKLFVVDTAIAVSGIVAGLVVSWMLVYMSDRFWDTPGWCRGLFSLAGLIVTGVFTWPWIQHWLTKPRDNRVLAAIVQRKHRRLGDRLVSAVELADHEQRPEDVSEALCRAAIEQIDKESERYSFNEAVATRKPLFYSLGAIFVLGGLFLTVDHTPDASRSALKRWAMSGTEQRYTFVEEGGLTVDGREHVDGVFYVPRGEEFALHSKYAFADAASQKPFWKVLERQWKVASASAGRADDFLRAELNFQTDLANTFETLLPDPSQAVLSSKQSRETTLMENGEVTYNIPGRTKKLELALRMGDTKQTVTIQPVARPNLELPKATVTFPDYLQYKDAEREVHGTVFSYLEGSQVAFSAQATRNLNQVQLKPVPNFGGEIEPRQLEVNGDQFQTQPIELDDYRELEFVWRDAFGIDGAQPWTLTLERQPDNPPHRVDCPGQAPVVAILLEEVLDIRMMAEDDYGLKVLSAEWEAFQRGETNRVAQGTTVLREFEPRNLSGDATYLFDPRKLKLKEGMMVNIYAAAQDYYRSERTSRSLPFQVYILSPEEHAQIIQQNFESKMAELDDLVRRQENLLESTRETQQKDAEQMKSDLTDKQIGRQEQEQNDIANKLKELADDLEDLSKEALKNKEIDPNDLAKMAQAQQQMQNLSQQEMQQAQQALAQAQQAQQNQQERKENLEKAEQKEKEALDKMKEMQEDANESVQDMYANTLVLRLRKIAEFEEKVSKDFMENIGLLIGRRISDLDEEMRNMVNDAYGYQGVNSLKAAELQAEIARFYDATQSEKFGEVAKLMAEVQPSEKMDQLAELTLRNQTSRVMGAAKELADHFNKWADILDPKNDGDGGDGGDGGEGGQPNEDLIERMKELLRLRQAEMDLRAQTRQLEAEHATRKPEQLEEDTFDLRFRQLMLSGDLQLEMEKRGEGEFLNAARYRMRDAEDELNLPGDPESLIEAYQWALVAKAQAQGDVEKTKAVEKTLAGLKSHLNEKQIKNASARADKILNNN